MAAHDRLVGGIRCAEVLEHLSDYLDRTLPEPLITRIEAHLRGCDWCERFGGRFTAAVTDLRETLSQAEPVPDSIKAHLRERLRAEISRH